MTHREAIESTYKGICRLYESKMVKDESSGITTEEKVPTEVGFPCRLSFGTSNVKDKEGALVKVQETKLFCAPEMEIPSGSMMEITQNERTAVYERSGFPVVYETHQEVVLTLKEEYT